MIATARSVARMSNDSVNVKFAELSRFELLSAKNRSQEAKIQSPHLSAAGLKTCRSDHDLTQS